MKLRNDHREQESRRIAAMDSHDGLSVDAHSCSRDRDYFGGSRHRDLCRGDEVPTVEDQI